MLPRVSYGSILFWLVPLITLVIVDDTIPSAATRGALAVAAILVGLSASLRQLNYPVIGAPFFVILLANYYQSYLLIHPLFTSLIVMAGVPVIGLWARRVGRLPVNQEHFIHWTVLGFLTAQINSLLAFWPFSYFENTLISFVAYYALWQVIQLFGSSDRRSILSHFVFTLVAVIVVVGALLWLNFPQFRSF